MSGIDSRESEWVEGLRRGCKTSFSSLLEDVQPAVFYRILRMTHGDEALARDVAQRTFLQVWHKRETFRGEASLRTWIFRIAHNLCLNELRRAHRRREVAPIEECGPEAAARSAPSVVELLSHKENRQRLAEAISKLPPRQRSVVCLRVYEELPFSAVALACEISVNSAKVNFHHAVRNLRLLLAAEGEAA